MISSPRSKKLVSLLRIKLPVFALSILIFSVIPIHSQIACYHDNQGRFYIFDNGKTIQAEYLPVKSFSVGARCLLYVDNQNHLKMYYRGQVTTLEVNNPTKFKALDYLAVYSIGTIVKIIDEGQTFTVSTNSISYDSEDSLVTFYDSSRELLAVYYNHEIHMLEDGLAGKPANQFRSGDNLVAYISSRTQDFKIFYNGGNKVIEPFLSGGSFKTGRDVVAFINQADQRFKVFDKGEILEIEEFAPSSYQVGDGIVAYIDNSDSFKIYSDGEVTDVSSFKPDFYRVVNHMVIYGEQGYFKVWYNDRLYTLESFIPDKFQAEWNTVVYRDLNRNVKVFSKGENKVLTYDLAEDINLYHDVIVVNRGMDNHNVYYQGKKY